MFDSFIFKQYVAWFCFIRLLMVRTINSSPLGILMYYFPLAKTFSVTRLLLIKTIAISGFNYTTKWIGWLFHVREPMNKYGLRE